jgi:mRNA interferase MazF
LERFDVYLINLDPTQGAEIQKKRPCVIISPDEMNSPLSTVIIAPMTTKARSYPTRVTLKFDDKLGYIALDQMRTVDKARLIKKLGKLERKTQKQVIETLISIFSE